MKWIYEFSEGSREMRDLLGGKGANLAEMVRVLGPDLVPAGFTITAEACVAYMKGGGTPPDDPKNPTVNFRGDTRRNATHQSTTDPDARLYKKSGGDGAKLAYLGHVLTENRHGLIVNTAVTAGLKNGLPEATERMAGSRSSSVASLSR